MIRPAQVLPSPPVCPPLALAVKLAPPPLSLLYTAEGGNTHTPLVLAVHDRGRQHSPTTLQECVSFLHAVHGMCLVCSRLPVSSVLKFFFFFFCVCSCLLFSFRRDVTNNSLSLGGPRALRSSPIHPSRLVSPQTKNGRQVPKVTECKNYETETLRNVSVAAAVRWELTKKWRHDMPVVLEGDDPARAPSHDDVVVRLVWV